MVDGVETEFHHRRFDSENNSLPDQRTFPETEFLADPPKLSDFRSLDAYDAAFNTYLDWFDQGELCINIPEKVSTKEPFSLDAAELPADTLNSPILVVIRYIIENPSGAIEFTQPDERVARSAWAGFAITEFSNSSSWFPCRNSHWERYSFDIDITVPSTYRAFCPGRLVKVSPANETQTKHTFFFEVDDPILARNMTFSVGEFETVDDTALNGTLSIHHCMSSGFAQRDDFMHTVTCTNEIFSLFSDFLGQPYPFSTYTQVLLGRTASDVQSFSNLTFISADLIHSDAVIDQTWVARRTIAEGIARSWITHTVHTRTLADHWIIEGLVGYLVAMYIERAFGRNERRLQRQMATDLVVKLSSLPWTLPISAESYGAPSDIHSTHFRTKSTIVMHMLADLIGETPFRDVIRQLISDDDELSSTTDAGQAATTSIPSVNQGTPLAVVSDKPSTGGSARGISTKRLLKLCRHRSALNLDDFCDRWINGVRCPILKVDAQFERKKSACKVKIEQSGVVMHGILKVYVYETDQQVYEHESRMDTQVESFVFSCHSKVRKNRKRFSTETGEEIGDDDDLSNGEEEVLDGDDGSSGEMGPDDRIGKKLKNDTPVRWVRVDPKIAWIRGLTLDQLPLWADLELRHSPDVIAQIEGAICLGRALLRGVISAQRGKEKDPMQTLMAFNALKYCLENPDYFYQVRVVAAQQLALCCRPRKLSGSDRQLSVLVDFLKSRLYSAPDRQLVEPSDFSDFSEHLVVRGVVHALTSVKVSGSGAFPLSHQSAMDIVIDLLKYNDSSQNYYVDGYYISSLLNSLSELSTRNQSYQERIHNEIIRFLDNEQLFPSYRRVVTCACLLAIARVQVATYRRNLPVSRPEDSSMRLGMELDPIDTVPPEQPTAQHEIPGSDFDLLAFTEDPHSPSVQVAAVAAAAEVAVYRPSMAILIANALSKQRSPSIRLRMAEAWASTWSHVVLDSSSPFESYETVSARPVVDSIWNLLTGPFAFLCHRFRIHMWVVFAAAFGTSTPKCLSSECLIKDRDILANKSMQKLPNAVRRSAALIRQKRTHEVQFSIKKKKGNTKKSDYMKATNETPSTVNMTEDITMEIL